MSTPIFLANAVALEIRNIMKSLEKGMKVRFDGDEGVINFIGDDYISITTNRWKDDGYRSGYRETNVLVYAKDWDNLEIEDEHFYNHPDYKGEAIFYTSSEYLHGKELYQKIGEQWKINAHDLKANPDLDLVFKLENTSNAAYSLWQKIFGMSQLLLTIKLTSRLFSKI